MRTRFPAAACLAALFLSACGNGSGVITPGTNAPPAPPPANTGGITTAGQLAGLQSNIGHIIVISQENWSFDGLYGFYPGANGYASAISAGSQVDASGNAITSLPQVLSGNKPDTRFTNAGAPVAPFDLNAYVGTSALTGDPNHNFYVHQAEIDGGKMDKYFAITTSPPAPGASPVPAGTQGGLPFGYYNATNLPEGQIAQQYVLMDDFRQAVFGGSFINNTWLFCACVTTWPNAPKTLSNGTLVLEDYDSKGNPIEVGSPEGKVTSDGYAVNTMFTVQYPAISKNSPLSALPVQNMPTIGDRLSAAGVSWAWYSGGLNNALAGNPDSTFQAHHQAPLFFASFAPGSPLMNNVKDDSTLLNDIANGTLPKVTFVKPLGANNEHPGYTNIITGQMYVANLISAIQMSPIWKDALIVVYYDEAGGHYDHVPPNPVDRWGPATRVPALIISPWARNGYVDHTPYETTSILATIETRFGLAPLGTRDANATPLIYGLDFTKKAPSAFARRPLGILPQPPPLPANLLAKHHPITELDD